MAKATQRRPVRLVQGSKHTSQGARVVHNAKGIFNSKKSKQLTQLIFFFTKPIRCFSIVELIPSNTTCPKTTVKMTLCQECDPLG